MYFEDYDPRMYMLCVAPAILLLGQIRNLKFLVPFSMVANLCLSVGICITLYYIFSGFKPENIEQLHYGPPSWSDLPKFFATVVFAIEGIGAVS